jgi:excisionase family DNA binding protein
MTNSHAEPGKGRRTTRRYFTITVVADSLDVSTRTVRRWVKSGLLPVHRVGRLIRISEDDWAAFLALRRDAGAM